MEYDWNLITAKEAAKILGVKPSTISGWIFRGKLPFPMYKVGTRCLRFKRTEIVEYLETIRK